jgi:hypothetical protein
MVSPGQLIDAISSVTGASRSKVFVAHRNLREAGLIATGGRGPSAAKMTTIDAALILLALTSGSDLKACAASVERYRNLPLQDPHSSKFFKARTAGAALADVLEAIPDFEAGFTHPDGEDELVLEVRGPYPIVRLIYRKGGQSVPESYDFFEPDPQAFGLDPEIIGGDLGYAHFLSQKTLLHIGKFLRG